MTATRINSILARAQMIEHKPEKGYASANKKSALVRISATTVKRVQRIDGICAGLKYFTGRR